MTTEIVSLPALRVWVLGPEQAKTRIEFRFCTDRERDDFEDWCVRQVEDGLCELELMPYTMNTVTRLEARAIVREYAKFKGGK